MLVEIKIPCDCGTKYKFDVEPLNGRMPQRVFCPGCGFEGTGVANDQLREKLAPRPGLGAKTAPLPVSSSPVRSEALEVLPPVAAMPLPTSPLRSAKQGLDSQTAQSRFVPGMLGAIVTAAVGALAWFFLVKVTGFQIGFAAWGIGLLVGTGARGAGREGSRPLAVGSGLCAFLALAGGQCLAIAARDGSLARAFSEVRPGWATLLWLVIAVASAARLADRGRRVVEAAFD